MARKFDGEVQDPNAGKLQRLFAKFEKIGDVVEGFFVRTEQTEGKFGPQDVFDFIDEQGNFFSVTASADLGPKLALVSLGLFVRIEYVSERPARVAGRSPMKIFKVQTSSEGRWDAARCMQEIAKLEAMAKAGAEAGAAPAIDPKAAPF